ncbi:MAG: hypothetical protein J6K12_06700 [Clostridia bacterium]|nr:hypothetical protein [Clostridia bacterium]
MQRRLFLNLLSVLLLAVILCLSCNAQNTNALEDAVNQAKKLTEYLSITKLFEHLTFGITNCFKSLISGFGISIAVLLVSGVFSAFHDSFASYSSFFDIISSLMIIACSFSVLISCFDTVEKCIESVCSYMTAFVPISAALLASSANTAVSASGAVINSFFISTVELICAFLILPSVKAMCSIHAVNTICKNTNLSGISSLFKSTCLWIIGLAFTIFCGILSLQTLLASSADNLAIKGIKYSAARLIPIAGGMISESMKTVIASMSYIKSVTGIGAIIYIIYTVIIPVCAIIGTKLYFFCLSALAKATHQDKNAQFFDSLQGCINILASLLLGTCVAFIIMLGLFIKVTVSL